MIYVYAPFARVTPVYATFVRTTLEQVTFVRATLVRVAGKIKWVLIPDSRWVSCHPSVEQLFSDADEEVTRRVNDELK